MADKEKERVTSPGAPPVLNSLLGLRFTLRRRLGQGSYGVVYEAFDTERNMVVALKTLQRLDPAALYKFKQEFRSLSDIVHPNLVTLYELFSQSEQWFFTMELLEGVEALNYVRQKVPSHQSPSWDPTRALAPTLQGLAPADPSAATPLRGADTGGEGPAGDLPDLQATFTSTVDEGRLRQVLQQLSAGLCFLHDAGKLHRDIKPSNILVTGEGRVVLLDFGLVREVASEQGNPHSNALVGTPAYMSPEQAASQPVTPASDWYSVGVLLYEALTGCLPFDGSWLQIMARKQKFDPAPPSTLVAGVPPDLDELCMDLLRRAPEQRPTSRKVLQRTGLRTTQRLGPTASLAQRRVDSLLGRERHLEMLHEALKASREGHPVTVLCHGSSGMGKSVLAHHFVDHLDAVVLSGRCYQQESVPYKALDGVVDTLSRYLRRLPIPEAHALLPRDILLLGRLFPVLMQVEAVATAPRKAPDLLDRHDVRRRAFEALRELLGRLADRQPVVLLIDDLQWGDIDSGVLLLDLLRPPEAPAVLLLICYRSEEAATSPCLQGFLPALRLAQDMTQGRTQRPTSEVREVVVGELSQDESYHLALDLLQAHALTRPGGPTPSAVEHAQAIAREAAGRPFFIDELVRFQASAAEEAQSAQSAASPPPLLPPLYGGAVTEGGTVPDTTKKERLRLEDVILSRVARLPLSAQHLLQVVAVAGQPIARTVACQAAELGSAEAQALALLRAGRLLRVRTTREREEFEAYHDRIRETVVAHLSPATLKAHHLRLALGLRADGAADAETLAMHYQGAGDTRQAARHAELAAAQAFETLAFERAARLYKLALTLAPEAARRAAVVGLSGSIEGDKPGALQLKLAESLKNAGRGAEAARAYLEAAHGQGPAEALERRRCAAEQFLQSGHLSEGLQALRTVLTSVGMKMPEQPWHALLLLILLRAWLLVRGLSFRERDAAQVRAAELLRIDTCWSVASGLGNGDTIRGAYFGTLQLLLALRAGEPYRVLRALAIEVTYGALRGGMQPSRTEREARERLVSLAERVNQPFAQAAVPLYAGIAEVLRGGWKKGVADLDRAAEILREHCPGLVWELDSAHHFALVCLLVLGRWREIGQRLPGILQDARQRGDLYVETTIRTRVAHLPYLAADQPDAAREAITSAVNAWSREGYYMQHYFSLISLSETELYAGAGTGASGLEMVKEHWPALMRSRLFHVQIIRGDVLSQRANVTLAAAAAEGKGSARRGALLRAAGRNARALLREDMPWIDAKARLVQAGIAAMRGEAQRALALLGSAEAGFTAADMAMHAASARRRRGELLGGDEGLGLIGSADTYMASQDIRAPERIAAMLAPGQWR